MTQLAVAEAIQALRVANDAYHRLVLLVGGPNTGKTALLQAVGDEFGISPINVSLELCTRLLELTTKQRIVRLPEIFAELITPGNEPVILDNTEFLFERSLQQDPLHLLYGISRNRQILAAWNGRIENGKLLYAEHGHSEYRQYLLENISAVVINAC